MLENQGFIVDGMSLVELNAVDFSLPKAIPDWIFFYSKNGVRFLLEKIDLAYFSNIKIAAIGEGTAKFLTTCQLTPDFIGNGNPGETARAFSRLATGKKVLFPRANNSRQSVQYLLNDSITVLDLIVYENTVKTDFSIPYRDCLVFTSPLNASAYFDKYPIQKSVFIFSIGQTTAKKLQELGVSDFFIANNPSEAALAQAVIDILQPPL